MKPELLFVLDYLDEGIAKYESMIVPNEITITQQMANENTKKAGALRKAKGLLVKSHNANFAQGIITGLCGIGCPPPTEVSKPADVPCTETLESDAAGAPAPVVRKRGRMINGKLF